MYSFIFFSRCTHRRGLNCNKGAARSCSDLPVTRLESSSVVRHYVLHLIFVLNMTSASVDRRYLFPPLPEDEGSSKEEPSSTVEEIETKSFTEQSSEEIQREKDEGTKTHFYNPQPTFSAFAQLLLLLGLSVFICVCVCVCSAETMPARALPAQRALQSMEKGKLLFLIKFLFSSYCYCYFILIYK